MYKDIRNYLIGSKQKATIKIKDAKISGNKIEWKNEIQNKKSLTNVLNYINKDLSIKRKTAKERYADMLLQNDGLPNNDIFENVKLNLYDDDEKGINQFSLVNSLDLVRRVDPCPPLLVNYPLNANSYFSCLAFNSY